MSTNACFFPLAAAGATAFALVAAIFVPSDYAYAAEAPAAAACPKANALDTKPALPNIQSLPSVNIVPTTKVPGLSDANVVLDQDDEYAALESVQFALTEVADGASYVWRREHGKLSGIVKPIASFKDTRGSVCRHAVVALSGPQATKRTEIVACRLPTGVWELQS